MYRGRRVHFVFFPNIDILFGVLRLGAIHCLIEKIRSFQLNASAVRSYMNISMCSLKRCMCIQTCLELCHRCFLSPSLRWWWKRLQQKGNEKPLIGAVWISVSATCKSIRGERLEDGSSLCVVYGMCTRGTLLGEQSKPDTIISPFTFEKKKPKNF